MASNSYQSVVIIGAPRSGTNMLRDILTCLPGVGTWPCDEINYIWRHGNVRFPSDEFTSQQARPEVQRYIRSQFSRLASRYQLNTVLEKTCANSMRVGFVDAVLPDAKYIFMVRDGLDVIGSAILRWKAELDIPYLMKKARYVPMTDLPYYASRYLRNRVHRFFSRDKQLAFWGPQMNHMQDLLQRYSLPQVCALQWQTCVRNSQQGFAAIDSSRVIRLRYEDFVCNPAHELQQIAEFMGKPVSIETAQQLTSGVSGRSVGKGRASLDDSVLSDVIPLIGKTLADFN